jgi:hypothetical protein
MLRSLHSIRENADVPKNGAETQKTGSCYAGRNVFYNVRERILQQEQPPRKPVEKGDTLWPIGNSMYRKIKNSFPPIARVLDQIEREESVQ